LPQYLLSGHVRARLAERTSLDETHLLDILQRRRFFWLSDPSKSQSGRAQMLFYSVVHADFFVVAVACNQDRSENVLLTILTQAQFENFDKPLTPRKLMEAVMRSDADDHTKRLYLDAFSVSDPTLPAPVPRLAALTPEQHYKWLMTLEGRARRIRIRIEMKRADGGVSYVVLRNAPGSEVVHLRDLVAYPGFLDWLSDQAAKKQIPVERVTEIKISRAGEEPVRLALA
jgi:hypothetical protein